MTSYIILLFYKYYYVSINTRNYDLFLKLDLNKLQILHLNRFFL
jgi:hypothetical protein